ncbi:MAG: NAD-dependent epimerase/dehydratase family protein [Gammaproteobacteria bacterium]
MTALQPQQILVTGGAGFIGASVVRKLRERYPQARIRVMHLPQENLQNLAGMTGIELVSGDVTEPAQVDAAVVGCDVVFHLAAIYAVWLPDMSLMRRVNVDGTRNVLSACERHGVRRVVYTSSAVCFCGQGLDVVSTEESPFSMRGQAYAESKHASHRVAETFAKRGLDVVIVCPVGPFGPGDVAPTPTGRIILEIFGMPWPVALRSRMNLIDVRDCAMGHVLALERGRSGESYLLGGENYTHAEVVSRVLALCGDHRRVLEVPPAAFMPVAAALTFAARFTRKPPFVTPSDLQQARNGLVCDAAKARRELGLTTRPLDDTLRDALAWFVQHGYITDARAAGVVAATGPT